MSTTPQDYRSNPSFDYRFFLYCPSEGYTYWKTEKERDLAAAKLISECLDEGEWNDEVTMIFAGTATHHVVETDRDEYWGSNDYDYRCDHALKPLPAIAPISSQQP